MAASAPVRDDPTAADPSRLGRPRPARMLWVTAAWGACFVAIQWGLRDAPVLWFAALRALVAGGALVAVAAVQQRPRPAGRRAWWLIAMLAVTNASIAFAAMFAGVDGIATGTAAVLAVPGGGGSGAWLSILAALAITAGTLLSRRLVGTDVVQAAGWHFLIGGAVLAAVAGAVEGVPRIDWTLRFVLSLAFLALIGTALAFWAWFTETLRCPLGQLAAWTFLTPVFGVAFGALLTSGYPSRGAAAGMGLVLASLWVAVRSPAAGPP